MGQKSAETTSESGKGHYRARGESWRRFAVQSQIKAHESVSGKGHLIITEVSPFFTTVSSRHKALRPNFPFITYRPELLLSKV